MKSHALSYLIDLVEENDIDAPEELSEADVLSPWAVEFRYEGEDPPALDRSAALVLKVIYRRGTKDEQVFDGRHEPVIDQATFDLLVQTRLDEKRVAGERPRVRQHYLRGSVYCGECGNRLTFGINGTQRPQVPLLLL